MRGTLNYRGLRRWLSLPILMVLFPLSAAFIGVLLGTVLVIGTMGFSAVAIANTMIVFVAPIVGTIVLGALGAVWGLVRAKPKTIAAFSAVRLDEDHPLARITADLAATINLPMPEVYAYESDDINAWATGSSASNAAIGMTTGAIKRLSPEAQAAIIAHELGHIASGDMVRMQMAISFQNATVFLAGCFGMRTPARNTIGLIGEVAVKWLSRRREYWADALGAALTDIDTMTNVLRSLESQSPNRSYAKRHHLLFHWTGNLLASHPSVAARCHALNSKSFVSSVQKRLGMAPASASAVPNVVGPRLTLPVRRRVPRVIRTWNELPDSMAAGIVFVIALPISIVGWNETILTDEAREIAQSVPTGPRVAAWSQQVTPEPSEPKASRAVAKAALPVYPKEPRYEPDDATGDGDLTPYQLLVEQGVACIYQAKSDDTYGTEHLEDAGPDKSDLFAITLPAKKSKADLLLMLTGTITTQCWEKLGGTRQEPDIMKRMQQPYDVWVLTDAESGATAECGVWPVARYLHPNTGAVAAYCR